MPPCRNGLPIRSANQKIEKQQTREGVKPKQPLTMPKWKMQRGTRHKQTDSTVNHVSFRCLSSCRPPLVVHQTRALTWSTAPFMLWCIQQLFEISCCNSMGISSIIDIITIFWYFLLATSFPRRNKFWTQKYNGNCDFFPPFQISGATFNSISIIFVQHHGGTPQNFMHWHWAQQSPLLPLENIGNTFVQILHQTLPPVSHHWCFALQGFAKKTSSA